MSKKKVIELYKNPDIEVRSCEWGFGVFATDDIDDNIILEDDAEEAKFNGLVLGYGSIFNHSNDNNASYYMDTKKNVYVFHSIRKIKKGEQITISYGEEWWTSRDKKSV